VEFKTKPQIALEQLRWAHQAGLPRGVALLDAGYANNRRCGMASRHSGCPTWLAFARPQRCGHPAVFGL
jgi:DDE superfamily endonuclease